MTFLGDLRNPVRKDSLITMFINPKRGDGYHPIKTRVPPGTTEYHRVPPGTTATQNGYHQGTARVPPCAKRKGKQVPPGTTATQHGYHRHTNGYRRGTTGYHHVQNTRENATIWCSQLFFSPPPIPCCNLALVCANTWCSQLFFSPPSIPYSVTLLWFVQQFGVHNYFSHPPQFHIVLPSFGSCNHLVFTTIFLTPFNSI